MIHQTIRRALTAVFLVATLARPGEGYCRD